jgi:hypothetical protein
MHWNIEQILWALVLAAHLILLIVLIGRDRIGRFPLFTAAIVLATVRLIADHLLHSKLTAIAFYWQSYSLALLGAMLGILVLAELSRRVFASGRAGIILKPKGWIGGILATVAIAGGAVWALGPWPSWSVLSAEPALLYLRLTWLAALKFELFLGLLTVQVLILLLVFGRRFGSGLKSHPVQIAIALSTSVIAQFAVSLITDSIKKSVHLTSRAEYDRVVRLLTNLDNARFAVWLLSIVWMIVWLWRDDPSLPAAASPDPGMELIPVGPGPGITPALEAEIPEDDRFEDRN